MVAQKRKNAQEELEEGSFEDYEGFEEVEQDDSGDEIDLSNVLSNKKPRISVEGSESGDDNLEEFLHATMAKRDQKAGTETIKKLRGGKGKLVKGEVGGGSFQSMGLHPPLLRSLTLQGYRLPTPIQRLSIPILLSNPPRDLVAMARTGSGKTLAYMIPLVQRLGGRHASAFGARALILTPTRELGLQQLKVGKSLIKGWASNNDHAGDKDNGNAGDTQALRWGLIVGGEGMDEQFEMIASNPDVIIATPGRLLHLIVEMNLDLSSVQYVVFDEADRLFEMGFETALTEIIHRLPLTRQTLLFSATLPKTLVEFAKAGLQEPQLVRLDVESKISPDLKMSFFSVHQDEKEACLLTLLRDVVKVPFGSPRNLTQSSEESSKKGKDKRPSLYSAPNQTLIFVATKHHVEFISMLLTTAGYSVSHIYGSLDQAARTHQMDQFRKSITNILVVTDVAARGIDIPILEHVINYDFPHGSRVFVHRVGRTARAGRQGWAWSFVTNSELPHLLDLQLFLGRPLKQETTGDHTYIDSLVIGTFERTALDEEVEYIRSLEDSDHSLVSLRNVMKKGHSMYERSKGKASAPSYKRSKEMMKDPKWLLAGSGSGTHPVFLRGAKKTKDRAEEEARQALMRSVNSFTPNETVFELGTKGNSANAALMNQRRKALMKAKPRANLAAVNEDVDEVDRVASSSKLPMADNEDISATFGSSSVRDPEFYMSHYEKGSATEKGYSLTDGATFAQQAQQASFDLTGDEGMVQRQKRGLRWDKKKKKFVKGDGVGADNVKLVRTESGAKLPATYRSGRFDEWKAKTRMHVPKVGETENQISQWSRGNRKYRHNNVTAPKPLDKLHQGYERKVRQMKKQESAEPERGVSGRAGKAAPPVKPGIRYHGKNIRKVKTELKTSEQIRKDRKLMEKRRVKNARPSRKQKGRK